MSAVEGDLRGQLAWEFSNAPKPWKVGDILSDPAITITGNPTASDENTANQYLDQLTASGQNPWIVGIKLLGEEGVLHVRAYLENPPADRRGRGITTLPNALQDAIRRLSRNVGGGALEFSNLPSPSRSPRLVKRVLEALSRDCSVLLVGPPGTGKTVVLEDLRSLFEQGDCVMFDPEVWDNAWSMGPGGAFGLLPPGEQRMVEPLVFHPSYGFEEFVAGLVPHVDDVTRGIRLDARPGPLLSLAHWASSGRRRALLIIDEFNRGPAAAIFGDTLALLDGSKRSDPAAARLGASIRRPYPRSAMKVAESYKDADGKEDISPEVRLPASLWIVAAMNSSDRSVAPLDAALRRRFSIIHVGPDHEALSRHLGLDAPPEADPALPGSGWETSADEERIRLLAELTVRLLCRLNRRIAAVMGQDFLLGHALLWDVRRETGAEMLDALAAAFDQRVAATLRLTFLDQDEALAAVLNMPPAPADGGGPQNGQARAARWRSPPRGLEAIASPRLELISVAEMKDSGAKLQALLALL